MTPLVTLRVYRFYRKSGQTRWASIKRAVKVAIQQ
jgi:hypothetical protein